MNIAKLVLGSSVVGVVGVVVGIRHKNKKEVSEYYTNSFCSEIDGLVYQLKHDEITIGKFQDSLSKIACCENYRNLPKKYKTQVDSSLDYADSLITNSWQVPGNAYYSSL